MSAEYVIRILLEARDTVSRSFADMANHVHQSMRGINDDIDRNTRNVDNNRSAINRLKTSWQGLETWISNLRPKLRSLSQDMQNARNEMDQMGSVMMMLAVKYAAPLLSILYALVAQLGAVVTSAGMAAAALGVTLSNAIMSLIPQIGVFVISLLRLKDVLKAVQLESKAQGSAAEDLKSKQQAVASATDQVRAAQEALKTSLKGVTDAKLRQSDAVKNLTNARKQAVIQLRDTILAEKQAQLAAEGASLSQEEARRRLQTSVSGGASAFEIAQAQLDVKSTSLSATEAQLRYTRAQAATRQARAQGIGGSDIVTAAQRQLRTATEGVANAERQVANAERQLAEARKGVIDATNKSASAQTALNKALAGLDPAERRLYRTLLRIKDEFKTQLRGISDPIVLSINDSLKMIERMLKTSGLFGVMRQLSQAMATSIRTITRAATSPESVKLWSEIIRNTARDMPKFTDAFVKFAGALVKITAAGKGKFLHDFIDGLDKLMIRFDKWASNSKEVTKFLDSAEKSARAWGHLFTAIIGFFAALGSSGGLKEGDSAIEHLADTFDRWANSMRENEAGMKRFWDGASAAAGAFWAIVVALGAAVSAVFAPGAVGPFAEVLNKVLIPAIVITVNSFTNWFKWFHEILALPFVAEFAKWAIAALLVYKGLDMISKGITAVIGMFRAMGVQGLIIAAIVILFYELEKHFKIVERLVALLKQAWVDDFAGIRTTVTQFWNWLKGNFFDALKAAWGGIADFFRGPIGKDIVNSIVIIFKGAFDLVKLAVTDLVNFFRRLGKVFGDVFDLIGDVFHGRWSKIGKDMKNLLIDSVKLMVNELIDGLNLLVRAWNWVNKNLLSKIGIDIQVPRIPNWGEGGAKSGVTQKGTMVGAAEGGIVKPVPGGVYRVAEAGHPELIVPLDPKMKSRARELLQYGMKAVGFAGGGAASQTLPPLLSSLIEQLRKRFGVAQGSTYRPGDPGYHGLHEAVDITGSSDALFKASSWLIHSGYFHNLLEGIHNPNLSVKFGEVVDPSYWDANGRGGTWLNHLSHIHLAAAFGASLKPGAAPGAAGFGDTGWLGTVVGGLDKGIGWLYDNTVGQITSKLKSVLKDIGNNEFVKMFMGGVVGKTISGAKHLVGNVLGFASGGLVTRPTLALLGENGPELVTPLATGGIPRTSGLGGAAGMALLNPIVDRAQGTVNDLYAAFVAKIDKVRADAQALIDDLNTTFSKMSLLMRQKITQMKGGVATTLISDGIQLAVMNYDDLMERYDKLIGVKGDLNSQLTSLNGELKRTTDPAKRQQIQAAITELKNLLQQNAGDLQDNIEAQVTAQEAIKQAQSDAFQKIVESINNLASYQETLISAAEAVQDFLSPADAATKKARLLAKIDRLRNQVRSLMATPGFELSSDLAALLPMLGFASGGAVSATRGGIPIVVGEGGYDEYVISTDPKYRARNVQLIAQALKAMGRGYAEGGWINYQLYRANLSDFPNAIVSSTAPDGSIKAGYVWVSYSVPVTPPPPVIPPMYTPPPPSPTPAPPPAPTPQQNQDLNTAVAGLLQQILTALTEVKTIETDAFQAQIDGITKTIDRALTLEDITRQIAELNKDQAGQLNALNARTNTLISEQEQYRAVLAQPGLTGDQKDWLTLQIRQLDLTILQNQKAIEELKKQTEQAPTQSFTTTAWRVFRQAIFNGSGGLLPQYQIPYMQTGGTVTRSGLFYLHAGEAVTPATKESNDTYNLYVTNPTEVADPGYLARRFAFELRS